MATFEGDSPETVRANRISLRTFFSEGTNALQRAIGVSLVHVGSRYCVLTLHDP